jgi:hypothetical protein
MSVLLAIPDDFDESGSQCFDLALMILGSSEIEGSYLA